MEEKKFATTASSVGAAGAAVVAVVVADKKYKTSIGCSILSYGLSLTSLFMTVSDLNKQIDHSLSTPNQMIEVVEGSTITESDLYKMIETAKNDFEKAQKAINGLCKKYPDETKEQGLNCPKVQ